MSESTQNSLVNLGELSKPVDTLIRKVSQAVGGLFEPYQIERVAKAEAKAAIIKAEADIQITGLQRRALHRFFEEEAAHQANMESITAKAIPLLDENAKADEIDDDWIRNFFNKSRIVSDDEMQELWARVLAGEANVPGAYSKRTVNFIGELDKNDAMLFTDLCGFAFQVSSVVPLVFNHQDDIYTSRGINFQSLGHLESIGLIRFDLLTEFRASKLPKRLVVQYYGNRLELRFDQPDGENELRLGRVFLTKIGQELARVCNSAPVPGFLDHVRKEWKQYLVDEASEKDGDQSP